MPITILLLLLFGVTQAVLEFLPVSSSSHLMLLHQLLSQCGELPKTFFSAEAIAIISNFGTTAALLYHYRGALRHLMQDHRTFLLHLVTPSIPLLLAPLLKKFLIDHYPLMQLLPIGMTLSSCFLLLAAYLTWKRRFLQIHSPWKAHLFLGMLQVLACIPGVSRSGWTLSGGLLLGWGMKTSLYHCFLMAIPAGIGAAAYQLFKAYFCSSGSMIDLMHHGSETSLLLCTTFIIGVAAYPLCKSLLLKLNTLWPFALYTLFLALWLLSIR
jgi:undecaprenyl-diphosphatase